MSTSNPKRSKLSNGYYVVANVSDPNYPSFVTHNLLLAEEYAKQIAENKGVGVIGKIFRRWE